MSDRIAPLVSPEALKSALLDPRLVLVDARSGPDARARFEAEHLAGAVHVDLDRDMAEVGDPARGGRHPLPPLPRFAEVLGRVGITAQARVVIADDKGGANAAARLWWMLRAVGHRDVRVLDGGIAAAIAAGVPVEPGAGAPRAASAYPVPGAWQAPLADADEVERVRTDAAYLVIDVRDPVRFRGESDPFDPQPGHIPGAVNAPFPANLGSDGRFLSPETLAERYRALFAGRDAAHVIVHCGSGVTACHTLLALEHAGLPQPALYVGSWSEWCRAGRPIAKGA